MKKMQKTAKKLLTFQLNSIIMVMRGAKWGIFLPILHKSVTKVTKREHKADDRAKQIFRKEKKICLYHSSAITDTHLIQRTEFSRDPFSPVFESKFTS